MEGIRAEYEMMNAVLLIDFDGDDAEGIYDTQYRRLTTFRIDLF